MLIKSLRSPFEWKSLWSLDALSSLEKHDMSILLNSVDGKDDAVGLMKHLCDHAASAYAQAEEILSNDENNLSQVVTPAGASNSKLNEDKRDSKAYTLDHTAIQNFQ